jgi:hypothetical protein
MKNSTEIVMPTEAELIQYHEGTLDKKRLHEIEELALDHPIVMDALEGYAFVVSPTGGSTSSTSGGSWKGWIIGGAIVAAAIVGVVMLTGKEDKSDNIAQNQPAVVSKAQNPDDEAESKDTVTSNNTKERPVLISIPKESRIDILPIEEPVFISDIRGMEEINPIALRDTEVVPRVVNKDVTLRKDNNDYPNGGEVEIHNREGITYMGKILFIHDYKIVDYTLLRREDWSGFDPVSGIDAKYEDQKAKEEDRKLAKQDHQAISYLTFLDQSISAFDKGSYRLSEEKFSVILGQYPDDVNALFYGGLSSFQIGNYNQAILWFQTVLNQPIKTFYEEAEFYLGMSHKAAKDYKAANEIFRRIKSKGGFYAQKASESITE